MSTELQQLRAENGRLSQLVAALAEKNLQLEAALAQLRPPNPATGKGPYPGNDPTTAGVKDLFNLTAPIHKNESSATFAAAPSEATERAILPDFVLSYGADRTIPGEWSQSATLPADYRQRIAQLAEEGDRQQRVARLAAGPLPPADAVARQLQLRQEPRLLGLRARHLAALLLWLCRPEPQPAPYPVLQRALGLSYGGVSKLLAAALQRGLLQKAGKGKYRLLEAGLAALEGAAHTLGPSQREGGEPHP